MDDNEKNEKLILKRREARSFGLSSAPAIVLDERTIGFELALLDKRGENCTPSTILSS